MSEQPDGPTPEQGLRAAGNHLRDAAAVLRQALAADDETASGTEHAPAEARAGHRGDHHRQHRQSDPGAAGTARDE